MGSLTIFAVFLRLGLTSFGGPIAHLGYFRREFVERRRWLSEAAYADLVALCQFLPGPASSQTGFAIGLMRGGWMGGLAAFLGFTLPSALLMGVAALYWDAPTGALSGAVLHGLKLLAVAVVAQAVTGMARTLTPDGPRAAIAVAAMAAMVWPGGAVGQMGVIALAAVAGALLLPGRERAVVGGALPRVPVAIAGAAMAVLVAATVAAVAVSVVWPGSTAAVLAAIYRAGALVFGGGHVVLPMLSDAVVTEGAVTPERFLAGYGLAQAVPGPMFSFATYLGALVGGPEPVLAAALATMAIFLPGLMLVAAALPYWSRLRSVPRLQRALDGVNAAVVGLLGATLYDPLWTTAVGDRWDVVIVAGGFAALVAGRMPALLVVVGTVAASGARVWI
ncbi:chromate efflux transporter [Oryzibacter oryziterrae]|uniref:chromate efflux transporter n=1 Tax=Oryzibacter oryziterrae TaxID=2766474 RepID=UPI001F02FC25|nr:chromate efflux transporter [Oryzibacter oryziterrae]